MGSAAKGRRNVAPAILVLVTLALALPAHAEVARFGPFTVDSDRPGVIHLSGAIALNTAEAFREALAEFPDLAILTLDSEGGATFVAAAIGAEVSRHGLATAVLAGDGCFSACPLIFFAGESRLAIGPLGVHQISFQRGASLSPEDVQYGVSRYIEVLVSLDLHPEIILAALGTGPDDMHVFSRVEVAEWGIERDPDAVLALLELDPPPARDAAIAEIEDAFAALLADEAGLRARVEADVDPLSEEVWAALRTVLAAALLDPASGERLLSAFEANGLTLDAVLAEDNPDFDWFLSWFESNLTIDGFLRLSTADHEWYLGYTRAVFDWLEAERPEACTDPDILLDPAMSVAYVGSLGAEGRKDYVARMLRAIDAAYSAREPEFPSNDTRRFTAENAVAEAIMRVATEHPRGAELMAPDPGSPIDLCLVTQLTVEAIDSLPADIRADALLLLLEPVPYAM